MSSEINIGLAQINVVVGGIENNVDRIIDFAHRARDQHKCELLVCAELVLTGYPPEQQLQRLCESVNDIDLIVGYPKKTEQGLFNMAAMISGGVITHEYAKMELPNYSVFDEKRYFKPGQDACLIDYKGIKLGLTVCEDIWHDRAVEQSVAEGAQLIININGSPYHSHKIAERNEIVCSKAKKLNVPVVYVNQIGGQDELVFDGASFAVDAQGEVVHQMKKL